MASIEPTKRGPDGKPARDTKWQARYRDPNGRSRKQTFARKVDAEQFLAQTRVDVRAGEWVTPELRRTRFDDWVEVWWRTTVKLAPSTRRSYHQILRAHVLPFFSGRKVTEIDYADVEEFIAGKLEAGLSPKYVRDMVSVVALIMDGAIRAKARRDNPAHGHRIPRRRRRLVAGDVLDMGQVRHLIQHVPERWRAAVWMLVLTGMRPSELAALRVRSVDFPRRRVSIDAALVPVHGYGGEAYTLAEGPPKTDAGHRDVPIPGWLCDMLAGMLAARAERRGGPVALDEYLFVQANGGPVNVEGFRKRVMVPALRAAGLPTRLRTYDLRHSSASLLIDQGANVLAVAQRLGHSDPSVTLRVYGHLYEGVQEELTDRLDALARAAEAAGPEVVSLEGAGWRTVIERSRPRRAQKGHRRAREGAESGPFSVTDGQARSTGKAV